mmetsp:Transcript_36626/g.146406  ORF Transcript_36626/g.146406 Transcript_36626/m.146406 type:complete len:137 (+) Transcript_36626:1205-1615(+)
MFGPLLAVHTRLLLTNKTTKEHLTKKIWADGKPYDDEQGWKHCKTVLCSERRESTMWKSYQPTEVDPEAEDTLLELGTDEKAPAKDEEDVEITVEDEKDVEITVDDENNVEDAVDSTEPFEHHSADLSTTLQPTPP